MSTSHRTLTRALVGAGLSAALTCSLLAGAPAAQARTSYAPDAAGDSTSYTFDDAVGEDGPAPVAAPDQADGDILRIRARHAATHVSIKVWFRDLVRTSEGRFDHVRIVTDEGVRRNAHVQSGPDAWAGTHELGTIDGRRIRCAMGHTTDYTANTVVVRVPRSCLSRPRWVRLGFSTVVFDGSDDGSSFTMYADDARRTGEGSFATEAALGGRLYRG